MRETNPCFGCGCYDADYGCSMPSIDKIYACPLEADEEELKEIFKEKGKNMEPITFTDRWGDEVKVVFYKDNYYDNDRIFIGCMCEDEEYGGYEPYCDVTVNLAQNMPDGNYGFLDTNNGDPMLFNMMFEKGYIEDTGRIGFSGFCIYPLVKFSDEFIKMIETN